MRVTVQLFARLRELAGGPEWPCEVRAGARVRDVWDALAAEHPALAEFAPAVSAAINADFAPMTAPVHDGDEVAFLPPVSGGSAGPDPF
jgi:molybdopterin converting factor subunit 1